MSTKFRGLKTGFNKTGSNDCVPNETGPPTTKFKGRGGVPEGPLKHFPGAVADTSGGNRRLAKSNHGEGDGSSTRYSGSPSGFSRGR